jgi:hypothetical protein
MTKYVDASPFEWLEGRLLPSDRPILSDEPQLGVWWRTDVSGDLLASFTRLHLLNYQKGRLMNLHLSLTPLISLVAGILILVMP